MTNPGLQTLSEDSEQLGSKRYLKRQAVRVQHTTPLPPLLTCSDLTLL